MRINPHNDTNGSFRIIPGRGEMSFVIFLYENCTELVSERLWFSFCLSRRNFNSGEQWNFIYLNTLVLYNFWCI